MKHAKCVIHDVGGRPNYMKIAPLMREILSRDWKCAWSGPATLDPPVRQA